MTTDDLILIAIGVVAGYYATCYALTNRKAI